MQASAPLAAHARQVLLSPCTELWNSANPKVWDYGYYDQVICKPFPAGTCCGSNFNGKR